MASGHKEFNDRKKMILKAVIDAYIRGGEPVGSKSLTQSANIKLSPATIRNEMSELEKMGYLEQPHTSAGRIPSEEGYRYYVRSLMQSYNMTMSELAELNRLTKIKISELDRIIESAGRLAGSLTNYTAMTFRGTEPNSSVSSFRAIRMNEYLLLLVMVMDSDTAQTRHINADFEITETAASMLEQTLNRHIAGVSIDEITLPVIMEMENEMGDAAPLVQMAIKCVYDAAKSSEGNIKFEGLNRLLQYQEYNDLEKFRGFLGLLEDHKDQLIDVVTNAAPGETNVYIGSDLPTETAGSSALIFKNIIYDGRVVGAIGVIGPSRMDYSKVITTVDYLSESIQRMICGESLPQSTDKQGDKDNDG